MATPREREILQEFIELYADLPCLWDNTSELYKDKYLKDPAWCLLADKLKEIDPEANITSAKKKVDNMRTAYNRELKKVKESKRTGASRKDMHVPNLWYFNLFSFLDKKDDQSRSGMDSLASEEESLESTSAKRPKKKLLTMTSPVNKLEQKKLRLIETAQQLLQQENKQRNSFGAYVGEQLDQLSKFQREVAEKLISEVIFLAKTENLNYDSKVETTSCSCHSKISSSPPPNHTLPTSPQCNQASPSQQFPSSHYIKLSPQPIHQISFSPQPSPPSFIAKENLNANPDSTILKELLIKPEPS